MVTDKILIETSLIKRVCRPPQFQYDGRFLWSERYCLAIDRKLTIFFMIRFDGLIIARSDVRVFPIAHSFFLKKILVVLCISLTDPFKNQI
jgi:hypothetical protein